MARAIMSHTPALTRTMKTNSRLRVKGLEKGQLWQMKETHLEIVEVGKRLAHYRLLPRLNQRGIPVKLGRREELETFLETQKAKLVRK